MNKNDLAEKIRILRKRRGLRQDELASKAGFSIRVIRDLEGAKGNPTLDSLSSISEVLQVPLVALLSASNESPQKEAAKEKSAANDIHKGHQRQSEKRTYDEFDPKGLNPNAQGQKHYNIANEVDAVDGPEFSHPPSSEQNSDDFRSLIAILPSLNERQLSFLLEQARTFTTVDSADAKPVKKDVKAHNQG